MTDDGNNNKINKLDSQPNDGEKSATNFIPKFFRSESNQKFIQGTIDQLISAGELDQLSGFVGRKTAKSFRTTDNYIPEVNLNREAYQLEPATVVKDNNNNIQFYKDYNDYINTLGFFGASTSNHSRLNSQETYSWDPHIDWDKFVNFREYYWMPTGPLPVTLKGEQRDVESTYTVSTVTDDDNTAFIINQGNERNPTLTLYRGQTYRFEINTPGNPIAFSISRTFTPGASIIVAGREGVRESGLFDSVLYGEVGYDQGEFIVLPSSGSVSFDDDENVSTLFPDGIRKIGADGDELATVYVENGTIEFTVPYNAPDQLYYISKNNIDTSGLFKIEDIEENTFLDVESDIIGKRYYQSADGISLSSGMKVKFSGKIKPSMYEIGEWYIEGVGTQNGITLTSEDDLKIPTGYSTERSVDFDSEKFDTLPYSDASFYAGVKDYLTINRASLDKNSWSRYNRWFHRSVIEQGYRLNGLPVVIDESSRAKRPIIEFEAGLKLYRYGTFAKQDVNVIDTVTTDVFSTIEGSLGYNVDGVDLTDGMRVLFTADTDTLVRNKIYKVQFIKIGNDDQISLIEDGDATPLNNEIIFATEGSTYAGRAFYFNNQAWKLGQEKVKINQAPKFQLYSPEGLSYTEFESCTFNGTRLFSYAVGTGENDKELGFPLSYRNIENSGDILFNFDLVNETFSFQDNDDIINVSGSTSNLKRYSSRTEFKWVNGFTADAKQSKQYVYRLYTVSSDQTNDFEVDVYNKASQLTDLELSVYLNNTLLFKDQDYTLNRINNKLLVRLSNDADVDDILLLKTNSKAVKNENGYYEFPHNLERNPLNEEITNFTLGEVIDHVSTVVEEVPGFSGVFPGQSNLRDLGDISKFGKKFVKHSGPLNNPLYNITSKDHNIVKALEYSSNEYNKFKRTFINVATGMGFDGDIYVHFEKVMREINKDKQRSQPFYFSDMLGYKNGNRLTFTIFDSRITEYPLAEFFNLDHLSDKSVLVYLNGKQLMYARDYAFKTGEMIELYVTMIANDVVDIITFETTNGSFVPPTPTKLGLYPKFRPELILDDTYVTDLPVDSKPYAVYGEVYENEEYGTARGWFYPVYASKKHAETIDVGLGGTGEVTSLLFNGTHTSMYMAKSDDNTAGGQESSEFETFPGNIPFIKGHDGSITRAYFDYRDDLLLEFETRIFNNIKVEWNSDDIDIHGYLGGNYRSGEFTQQEVNKSLLNDFTQWLSLVDNDYTINYFYDRLNSFTFNYSDSVTNRNNQSPGFWRGVYHYLFDTDHPHTQPWEMLGYYIKPSWWDEVYGNPPYTSNNLIMWKDLEQGIIRKPGKEIKVLDQYARPGLLQALPVDKTGSLLSPMDSGVVNGFLLRKSSSSFSFGDQAPVEAAWRKSSFFPFALLKSMILNKPAKIFNAGFDVSNNDHNLSGQRIYKPSGKQLSTRDLVFPTTTFEQENVFTAGLVNYTYNLLSSNMAGVYDDYKTTLTSLQHQLGIKLGGFSDKKKLNLVLESMSPAANSEASNFVPQENYQITLNTSSPLQTADYSGIVVEKTTKGFVVRGYSNSTAQFKYYNPIIKSTSKVVTVGGIPENIIKWETGKTIVKRQAVEYKNSYYRAVETFVTGTTFDSSKLVILPAIPVEGGKTATFYKTFDKTEVQEAAYGTLLENSQDVVNFILGYGEYLKDIGFDFNYVSPDGKVSNWEEIAKEFLFWTTQGWVEGTVISLSPAASQLLFYQDNSVVDDIYDKFYNYKILSADGTPLNRDLNNIYRKENVFGLRTTDEQQGLYGVSLPLVQKEHVLLIDNVTVFNDVIYHPNTGYRRDRIKLSGYRTSGWTGGLDIPGFIVDDVTIIDWQPWKDFQTGDIVRYKQYFYSANQSIPGSLEFDENQWTRLNSRPESELKANFDYKISQFSDFYDIDTQSFNEDLQGMASHLISFQKRDYLANIFNSDVSQFKFYQGMIQDKGTKNVLLNMFNKFDDVNQETLEFYEDWALRVGQFGSVDEIKQLEIQVDSGDLRESPQPIELVEKRSTENANNVYEILPHEMHKTPVNYNHRPFVTFDPSKLQVETSGFVNQDDVTYIATTIDELNSGNVNLLSLGDYIWVTGQANEKWNVYQHIQTPFIVNGVLDRGDATNNTRLVTVVVNKWINDDIRQGDIVGIRGASEFRLENLYVVNDTQLNEIVIEVPQNANIRPFVDEHLILTKLRSVYINDITELNELLKDTQYPGQKVWINQYENGWAVLQNDSVFQQPTLITNTSELDSTHHEFGKTVAVTNDNTGIFVSSPGTRNGVIYHYQRSNDQSETKLIQELELQGGNFSNKWTPNTVYKRSDNVYRTIGGDTTYWIAREDHTSNNTFDASLWTLVADATNKLRLVDTGFGQSFDLSPDSEFLAVGMPHASNVKTRFKGDFNPNTTYDKNDIVKYQESLWKTNRTILRQIINQPFNTFNSYINLSSNITSLQPLMILGDPGLEGNVVEHMLIKPPSDMFLGTSSPDATNEYDVTLFWNQTSYAFSNNERKPFLGKVSEITPEFVSQEHTIVKSIDHVFLVNTFTTTPNVGDEITTVSGRATVFYVSESRDKLVIYAVNSTGSFDVMDDLYLNSDNLVGRYQLIAPDVSGKLTGFWWISTPTYRTIDEYEDSGEGLVYVDLKKTSDTRNSNFYYNIQTSISEVGNYILRRNQVSFITQLSYTGDPVNSDKQTINIRGIDSKLWLVRVGNTFPSSIEAEFIGPGNTDNPEFEFRIYRDDDYEADLSQNGLSFDVTNTGQKVYDIWDGYIDFELTSFDFDGIPFQPQVGDILEDIQIPGDGTGGLALTSTTTSSAEVAYLQRDFNSMRVYLKNVTGSWNILNNIQRVDIRRLANTELRGTDDQPRTIGTIITPQDDIVIDNENIGKCIIFENDEFFTDTRSWKEIPPIVDEEYYFYEDEIEEGVNRLENPPYSRNKDYSQIFHISADSFGTPGPGNEGAVAIFRRLLGGTYRLYDIIVSEHGSENRHFGSNVILSQDKSEYTLFVSSEYTSSNPRALEVFYNGDNSSFVGEYNPDNQSYKVGDVVRYKDSFYSAAVNNPIAGTIENTTIWNNISWRRGVTDEYRGIWKSDQIYSEGDIVWNDNSFYHAITNIANKLSFDKGDGWQLDRNTLVNHIGYLPNLTNIIAYNSDSFDLDTDIKEFGNVLDITSDGNILAVVTTLVDSTSTADTKVLVYQKNDSLYFLDQVIDCPIKENNINWAASLSISPSGEKLAVGANTESSIRDGQGRVYIYTRGSDGYVLSQELIPPNNEENEQFGSRLDLSNETLAVTSLNGDRKIPTTFDKLNTTFDQQFTSFKNVQLDSGIVYLFEQLSDKLIYSETLQTKRLTQVQPGQTDEFDVSLTDFGSKVVNNQNHVYIAAPSFLNSQGTRGVLFDYSKQRNTMAWKNTRTSVNPVNLDTIEGIFVYNTKNNSIVSYIDYIDVVQGKLPGIVDQNLDFRVGYDPATYNVGLISDSSVNSSVFWSKDYVGKTWWNTSRARFAYPYQGDIEFQKNEWNRLVSGATIDIYEWVESDLLPSQWDELFQTGRGSGVESGTSLYGDEKYSATLIYDEISQTFSTKYFFWVTRKQTVPSDRSISIADMAELIARPRENGYRFVSMLSENKIVLNNFEGIITSPDNILVIRYRDREERAQSGDAHTQYQLISEGLETSNPDPVIEEKWFDSLIGFDRNYNMVPDIQLSKSNRIGVSNRPRQSMFINRVEALKQFIERVNNVCRDNLIVEQYDISNLHKKDEMPTVGDNEFDIVIDTFYDLRFVSTNKVTQAKLEPIMKNGSVTQVRIVESGRGYKYPPKIDINGGGVGASVSAQINNLGQIINVSILEPGENYSNNSSATVRPFSVLVKADENADRKWAIYSWNSSDKDWYRSSIQSFDVSNFWYYIDWYADGVNAKTNIDFNIKGTHLLPTLNSSIGDVVKVENIGSGGWVLLEKISNQLTDDFTVNYKTIGRQDGTIQFRESLYVISGSVSGFDSQSFDSKMYDKYPSIELRIIFETLRDDIMITDLSTEYNKLFFASIRYILSEQNSVDWLFKTSYINVKHKLGELNTPINYTQDSSSSFEEYVNEVKPYKTKVRQFIGSYTAMDNTNSNVTDFDNPPAYNPIQAAFSTDESVVRSETIIKDNSFIDTNIRTDWLNASGYSVTKILVDNGGAGYIKPPTITFESESGSGATARSYIGYGKVTNIEILTPGTEYINPPKIRIAPPQGEDGIQATASAIIGNGLHRTPSICLKFDRVSGIFNISKLQETEYFTGTNVNDKFVLTWPMEILRSRVSVYVDGVEMLNSQYKFMNATLDADSNLVTTEFDYGNGISAAGPGVPTVYTGHTRKVGQIEFTSPPKKDSSIQVDYHKDFSILTAEDRINFGYNPTSNMAGNNLSQLMDGIDYGGVEVKDFDFGNITGWDVAGWYTDNWDQSETFEDFIFTVTSSDETLVLDGVLERDNTYNVYKNGVRIDDPQYSVGQASNSDATMDTIAGDGETSSIAISELNVDIQNGDVIIVRKTSSDGSSTLDANVYDTSIQGGNFTYDSAKGIAAEEIIVDGDGFATSTNSRGPEELLPGKVMDTLDLTVHTRKSDGQGEITNQVLDLDGSRFSLLSQPSTEDSIMIKVDGVILDNSNYEIDWENNEVQLNSDVTGQKISILVQEIGVNQLVDFGTTVASTGDTKISTSVSWTKDQSVNVIVNGRIVEDAVIVKQGNLNIGRTSSIRLPTALSEGDVVNWSMYKTNDVINFSQVTKETFVVDSDVTSVKLSNTPVYSKPLSQNVLVSVDNKFLRSGYNIEYIIDDTDTVEFQLETFQQTPGSLQTSDLIVLLNGVEISAPSSWRFEIANSSIILSDNVAVPGDVLEIFVTNDAGFTIEDDQVYFHTEFKDQSVVNVYQFSNHDLLSIEKIDYDILSRMTISEDDINYVTYNRLTMGEVILRKPTVSANYVWVIYNGTLLTPNLDYYIPETLDRVQLLSQVSKNDEIEIIHFSAPVSVSSFKFRQFKDLVNRTHYKKIPTHVTKLSDDLKYFDLRIEVEDGSLLSEPGKSTNRPGIIWINGERIEYFVKENNTLRQLRRGTLGTGVPSIHSADTEVVDQSTAYTIPYQDQTLVQNFVCDGNENEFSLNFDATSEHMVEVFLSGTRLSKTGLMKYNAEQSPISPDGDVYVSPDFTVKDNTVILTSLPSADSRLTVVKKIGKVWTENGKGLSETQTSISKFITYDS